MTPSPPNGRKPSKSTKSPPIPQRPNRCGQALLNSAIPLHFLNAFSFFSPITSQADGGVVFYCAHSPSIVPNLEIGSSPACAGSEHFFFFIFFKRAAWSLLIARTLRGPSEAARWASTGDNQAAPRPTPSPPTRDDESAATRRRSARTGSWRAPWPAGVRRTAD